MRIISGKFRGRVIHPPKGLPVRPTTDMAKESLFNILNNRLDFDGMRVLDCFAGTGSMSYEFLSRGVGSLLALDADAKCVKYISSTFKELAVTQAQAVQTDVLRYLAGPAEPFDLIFMDPPYALLNQDALVLRVMEGGWLTEEGLLILEHASANDFSGLAYFAELRKYGGSSFSFFEREHE
jgi:16S rRNA (guanine966-N2)-methyltransferase